MELRNNSNSICDDIAEVQLLGDKIKKSLCSNGISPYLWAVARSLNHASENGNIDEFKAIFRIEDYAGFDRRQKASPNTVHR